MGAAVCSFVKLQVSNKLRGKTPTNSLKQQTSSAPVGIYSDLEHILLSLIKLTTFVRSSSMLNKYAFVFCVFSCSDFL